MECKSLHPYLQLLVTSGRCAAGRREQEDGCRALIHVFQIESVEDRHENAEKYAGHGGNDAHPAADHQQWRCKCDGHAAQIEVITPPLQVPH